MIELIQELILANPNLASVFVVIGVIRTINKPLFSIIRTIVEATPEKEDDKALDRFERSKTYKAILYMLDWFGSVKI